MRRLKSSNEILLTLISKSSLPKFDREYLGKKKGFVVAQIQKFLKSQKYI